MSFCQNVFMASGLRAVWVIRGEIPPSKTVQATVDRDKTDNLETWAVRKSILESRTVAESEFFMWHDSDDWYDPYGIVIGCDALKRHPTASGAFWANTLRASEAWHSIISHDRPSPANVILRSEVALHEPYLPPENLKGDRSGNWLRRVMESAPGGFLCMPGMGAVWISHHGNTSPGNNMRDWRGPRRDGPGPLPCASIPFFRNIIK